MRPLNKWLKTALYLVASVFLTRLIPFSSFFRNLDTMVHEFSHALVTLLLSGRVLSIELHSDHSGVTYSRLASEWSSLPVSLAGYVGASLFALLLFYLYHRGLQRLGLGLVTALAAITLILYVHTGFGVVWLIGFIALSGLMIWVRPEWIRNFYYLLIAFLSLEESAMGPISLVLYALNDSSRAGDASNLQELTGIPALLWALLFVAVSLGCVTRALHYFSKPQKQSTLSRNRTASRIV